MSLSTEQYSIDLPEFTGPLDLLLHLVERNEFDITAISLAAVTEQYLQQVKRLKKERVDQLIDFLVIGARLLVIKSRALLPQDTLHGPHDDDEEDPAETLTRQLIRYRRFKRIAMWLGERSEAGFRTYLRVVPPPTVEASANLSGVSLTTLIVSLSVALKRTEQLEDSVSVAVDQRRFTIEGQIQHIRQSLLFSFGSVYFNELLSDDLTWSEVSVTLLAVLEMIKRHEVNAHQPSLFGPIKIIAAESSGQLTETSRKRRDQSENVL